MSDDDDDLVTKGYLRQELRAFVEKVDANFDAFSKMFVELRRELLEDGARHAKAIKEEMKSLFRGSSEKEKALENRLDRLEALSAAPGRGGRASRTRRRR